MLLFLGAECARENRTVESKTYEILQQQIWSLLPAFCNKPIDLPEAFPGIAKILGSAIVDRPDLRQDVMASIRKLVTHNLEPGKNREVLARFAKNYLPLLFNIYTGDMEKSKATGKDTRKLAVLETAKCYLQISDKQVMNCTGIRDALLTSLAARCDQVQQHKVAGFGSWISARARVF